MKRVRTIAFVALALSIYACAAKPEPRRPEVAKEDDASHRVRKRGFAVGLPPNPKWYVDVNDQGPERFIARREMSGARYTFFFQAGLAWLDREPTSLADFAELARQDVVSDPARHKLVSYEQSTETLQQQWCIRYVMKAVEYENDLFAGVPMHVKVNGVICKHPSWPDVVLDMWYSARGKDKEFVPEIEAEAAALLASVTIEAEPPSIQ